MSNSGNQTNLPSILNNTTHNYRNAKLALKNLKLSESIALILRFELVDEGLIIDLIKKNNNIL